MLRKHSFSRYERGVVLGKSGAPRTPQTKFGAQRRYSFVERQVSYSATAKTIWHAPNLVDGCH